MVVTGVDDANLHALRDAGWTDSAWNALLRVTVDGNASTAVAGRYAVTDTSVEFRPLFPFDVGRSYGVRLEPKRFPVPLAPPASDSTISSVIAFAADARAPSTTVTRIFPTADTIPENQLRFYVEFSAPMSRQPGTDFVHLVDDAGHEVLSAFLPLDADFWNPDHTRYTLFLDPGRVKRGILPNEQLGRALHAGHTYRLVVDSTWRDANGLPLSRSFRREFRAGPTVARPIDLATWKIQPPAARTRRALVLTFPRALDHGLLQRSIAVAPRGSGAEPIPGDIDVGPGETEWRFTPRTAWRAGDYSLVVLSILEDGAGNRIGRAFEVDMFDRVDSVAAPERRTIGFTIR